tara:strand:- start:174 stop:767 length:594 start_codon:yes stop_codon:yes gene_type:complete
MREFRKFFNEHPFLGTAFLVAGAFTLYETISAVKAPKGEGPFSGIGHMSKKQQTELNAIKKELYGASKMHKSQADRINQLGGILGASTSTTSSTSSSHAMMDRPLTDDVMPVRSVGHSDFFGINPHVVGASNLGSANLPPAMRRRISQRQRGTGSLGNWGNVAIDLEDNIAMSHYNAVGDLYGLGGMTPEAGTGWTE